MWRHFERIKHKKQKTDFRQFSTFYVSDSQNVGRDPPGELLKAPCALQATDWKWKKNSVVFPYFLYLRMLFPKRMLLQIFILTTADDYLFTAYGLNYFRRLINKSYRQDEINISPECWKLIRGVTNIKTNYRFCFELRNILEAEKEIAPIISLSPALKTLYSVWFEIISH